MEYKARPERAHATLKVIMKHDICMTEMSNTVMIWDGRSHIASEFGVRVRRSKPFPI